MTHSRARLAAAALLAAGSWLPVAVGAQTPSYAAPGETIHGTIASVQSLNHLFVDDDRGYTDDVTLKAGAAIRSGGVRLEPGQRVTIHGSAAGSTFLATRIATDGRSYQADGSSPAVTAYSVPVPAYYPAPVYYPQPVYYPTYYSASLFFGFGPYYRYGRGFGAYGGYRPHGVGVRVHIR